VAKVEYPEIYVDREVESFKSQLERQLQQQNLELASYLQLMNTTEEAWRSEVRPQAEERLKRTLVLSEVVKDQGLQVSGEEIDAEIETTLKPLGEGADDMRELLATPLGRLSVLEALATRKGMERLRAIARGQVLGEQHEAESPGAEAPTEATGVGAAEDEDRAVALAAAEPEGGAPEGKRVAPQAPFEGAAEQPEGAERIPADAVSPVEPIAVGGQEISAPGNSAGREGSIETESEPA
jgi:hypothetical protein